MLVVFEYYDRVFYAAPLAAVIRHGAEDEFPGAWEIQFGMFCGAVRFVFGARP